MVENPILVFDVQRHGNTYPEYNSITRQRGVSDSSIIIDADTLGQTISFLSLINSNGRTKGWYRDKTESHEVDQIISSPTVRAMQMTEMYLMLMNLAKKDCLFPRGKEGQAQWKDNRKEIKLHQRGLASLSEEEQEKIKSNGSHPLYMTLISIDLEIRLESNVSMLGVNVDYRWRDSLENENMYTGMDRHYYESIVNAKKQPRGAIFGMINTLNESIKEAQERNSVMKKVQRKSKNIHSPRPLRKLLSTHGGNAVFFEQVAKYRGHEEEIEALDLTYEEQKILYGSIPHGSGIEIVVFENEQIDVQRYYVPSKEIRKRGVQPEFPRLPTEEEIDEFSI